MRPRDKSLFDRLHSRLTSFQKEHVPLPGLNDSLAMTSFIEQVIESVRRVDYVSVLSSRPIDPSRADPANNIFDPVRAAILLKSKAVEESFWLVFLFVHFGKSSANSWRLIRDVYGALGARPGWNWHRTSNDVSGFKRWLSAHQAVLRGRGKFGNHRKYQSLDAHKANGTGAAVQSYVEWVGRFGSHQELFSVASSTAGPKPRAVFDFVYHDMDAVASFGRTAKFDYLCMIGKLKLAAIEPGSTYLDGATGPLTGAKLLFGRPSGTPAALDPLIVRLGDYIGVGMQPMEDAICNWQKSPKRFKAFRG